MAEANIVHDEAPTHSPPVRQRPGQAQLFRLFLDQLALVSRRRGG